MGVYTHINIYPVKSKVGSMIIRCRKIIKLKITIYDKHCKNINLPDLSLKDSFHKTSIFYYGLNNHVFYASLQAK